MIFVPRSETSEVYYYARGERSRRRKEEERREENRTENGQLLQPFEKGRGERGHRKKRDNIVSITKICSEPAKIKTVSLHGVTKAEGKD